MKALSVRAPWWYFILHEGKDIENRDWPTRLRGTILLHASKWWNDDEVDMAWECAEDMVGRIIHPGSPEFPIENIRGFIVGKVDIVDCVTQSDSPWFCGEYGFVLRNPVAFANPIPYRGALGFFDVPNHLVTER